MLFRSPHLKLSDFCVIGSFIALVLSFLVYKYVPLTDGKFSTLLLGLEGTVFLSFSISFQIQPIGNEFIGKIRWALFEFPRYRATPSFDPLRFYLGIMFLFLSVVIGNLL